MCILQTEKNKARSHEMIPSHSGPELLPAAVPLLSLVPAAVKAAASVPLPCPCVPPFQPHLSSCCSSRDTSSRGHSSGRCGGSSRGGPGPAGGARAQGGTRCRARERTPPGQPGMAAARAPPSRRTAFTPFQGALLAKNHHSRQCLAYKLGSFHSRRIFCIHSSRYSVASYLAHPNFPV